MGGGGSWLHGRRGRGDDISGEGLGEGGRDWMDVVIFTLTRNH
jgi:hypothetical protein